jgi:phospholipase/carboxylesterase
MKSDYLECVELETAAHCTTSVIWLHGLGADGHDFEPIVQELRLPSTAGTRFVFPHAPVRPVTINGGMAMRAWFDLFSVDFGTPQDERGIRASSQEVEKLIQRENQRGRATERIILAGFSQGGAIALHTGWRYRERLLGIMGLSTFLPLADSLESEPAGPNAKTPIFMAHGQFDEVIDVRYGRLCAERLATMNNRPEWHEYPMGHAVCAEEVAAIRSWLLTLIGT